MLNSRLKVLGCHEQAGGAATDIEGTEVKASFQIVCTEHNYQHI